MMCLDYRKSRNCDTQSIASVLIYQNIYRKYFYRKKGNIQLLKMRYLKWRPTFRFGLLRFCF